MQKLDDESLDAIITDPPFNISVKNNFHTLKGRKGIDFGEWDKDIITTGAIQNKKDRVMKYMKYAEEHGTLK